jgi:uncharacterized protein (DUF1800 family)
VPIPSRSDLPSIVHLLNRAGYGPRPGQIQEVAQRGIEAYLEAQLDPAPDAALQARLRSMPDLDYPIAKMLAIYRGTETGPPGGIVRVLEDFYTAKLVRAVESKNQLQEVVVDFWFNHFNVNLQNMFVRQAVMAYERDAIRPHALGRFRDVLGASAAHPAMLFYLDNYLNKKDKVVDGKLVRGVNENYGRELLELHTLSVSAGYNQRDVVDSARCFTGWTIDDLKTSGQFVFRPEEHDTGPKNVFGLRLPAGGGRDDAEKLLDYLSTHPATARFISFKLSQRFVADDPPPSLVERCARRFLDTRGDIREVLRTLFKSDEFWAEGRKPKLKTPLEYVVSSLRATSAQVDSAVPDLTRTLANMGMQPYFCTPPTGYSCRGADWVNPLYLHRLNFAFDLASGTLKGVRVAVPDVVSRAGGNPASPTSVASTLNDVVFGGGLSRQTLGVATAVSAGVGVVSKVAGLILASPEMHAR